MKPANKAVLAGAILLAMLGVGFFFLDTTPTGRIYEQYVRLSYGNNPLAPVTLVEFIDFQCPYCKEMFPIMQRIEQELPDVNFVQKHIPSQTHPDAWEAAVAAECARDQNKYHEYAAILFSNQNALKPAQLRTYAHQLGLDLAAFDLCTASMEKHELIKEHINEAILAGVQGTPTYFINGKKVQGVQDYVAFKQLLEAMIRVSS